MSWWVIVILVIIAIPVALFLWMALMFGAAAWYNMRSMRKMGMGNKKYMDIFK